MGERARERGGAFAPEVRGMKAPPHPALSPKRAWGRGSCKFGRPYGKPRGPAIVCNPSPSGLFPVISRSDFDALAAQGHTRIPLVREVFSDLDTPLSVYLKLADGPYTFLFESVEGGATWGRYSIRSEERRVGKECRSGWSAER